MKKAVVLVGVPGSGKSTYARKLKLPHFSSDLIRMELFKTLREHHSAADDQKVFDRLHEIVFNYEGSLIYDATNTDRKRRTELYDRFKSNDFTVEMHLILEPQELALFQNKRRDFEKVVPDYVITDKYKYMAAPRIGVDCDSYQIISQSTFLKESTDFTQFVTYAKTQGILKTVRKYVSAAYLPEFARLGDPHDTPYHLEGIAQHIDMCIQNSNDNTMLITSILHDLGKSMAKMGGHYKGHETISSIYALRFFDEIRNVPPDVNPTDVIEIILQHMLAHRGISEKVIERNKLTPALLALIESFKGIDEKSRITKIVR